MAPHVRPRRTAFTLVEILCVVVILGIVGSIVGTQMGTRSDLVANAAARTLVSHLQFAQNRAVARREPHYLLVGLGDADLTVCTRDEAGGFVPVDHPVDSGPMRMTFGPAGSGGGRGAALAGLDADGRRGVGFDAHGEPFAFDPESAGSADARPSLAAPAELRLAAGPFAVRVVVEPVTGEVRVGGD